MLHNWRQPLSARTLAIGFLSTSRTPLRVGDLIRRGEVMGADAAAMRVALGRLAREGVVAQPERGLYAIGAAAAALDRRARGWAGASARVRPWEGRWLIVLVDHLGRSDRRQLRRRERALTLYGFVCVPGAWVRPDNLAEPDVPAQMRALGLDTDATVIAEARVENDAGWRKLWPVAAIEAGYAFWTAEMASSLERLPDLEAQAAARETLLLGQAVIRAINRDPLLPAEMVDTAAREAMVAAMQRYDAVGKARWAAIG